MTVQELITELQKHDPNMLVFGQVIDHTDWTYKPEIKVEEGNPIDESGVDMITGEEDWKYEEKYDLDGNYIGPKVLLINLGQI